MKRTFRFYFALLFARLTALAVKLIGRQGTSMPGSWAIILCPNFLEQMPKPKKIVAVTGTNGKTTTANMIADVLEKGGVPFCSNRYGSNVNTGIASTLIANSKFFGQPKYDLAVLEVDERSTPRIFPYMPPDVLVVTNLFRDSCKRNAHAEYIFDLLEKNIPAKTKLVLNGDDPISSRLAPENPRVYYGIEHLPGDGTEVKNIVNDLPVCPFCGGPLRHDVARYHHIGRVHCEKCGYASPKRDYLAAEINTDKMTVTIGEKGGAETYPLIQENAINIYNEVTAVAVLRELGLTAEQIASAFQTTSVNEVRYKENIAKNGKKVILHLAKAQNPVACSRAFENIRDYPGKKAVLIFSDDRHDAAHTVEMKAWLYDADYEFLNRDDVVQVLIPGVRHRDTAFRALLAGIPKEKILHDMDAEVFLPHLSAKADTLFILYELHSAALASAFRERILTSDWAQKGALS